MPGPHLGSQLGSFVGRQDQAAQLGQLIIDSKISEQVRQLSIDRGEAILLREWGSGGLCKSIPCVYILDCTGR